MVREVSARKQAYKAKLIKYLDEYKSIIVVTANFVGSLQLQRIRQELRGRAVLLMGKNTLVRMVLREYANDGHPEVHNFIPCVQGNCGLFFTNEDVKEMRDIIVSLKRPAAAKPGVFAPNDVVIPPGPTGLDPGQTSFFQSLNIATKIFKGQIEITNTVYLVEKGQKVGSSECALLSKLNITPFEYALVVTNIYSEGAVFSPDVLDLSESDLAARFFSAVRVMAALGLQLGLPNLASLPHSFANTFKKLLAVSCMSDYTFEAAEPYKEYLADPAAYIAKHGGPAAAAPAADGDAAAAGEEAAAEEEAEESESDEGGAVGGLFSGSDSDSDSDSD